MWRALSWSGLAIIAAFLSGFVTAGLAAHADSRAAGPAGPLRVEINRINKGDRLQQAWSIQQPSLGGSPGQAAPRLAPFGCDPAFSPIANPAHKGIFMRCTS